MAHWDEAERHDVDAGTIAGVWRDLGEAAGSVDVGLCRIEVRPGAQSTPAHRHGAEEEIFVVLGGSGWSWQDDLTYTVGPGDVLVHLAAEEVHTLLAGPDGLDVLAFGPRILEEATHLPRAGVVRIQNTWVLDAGPPEPYERESAAGPIDPGTPEERRPSTIVRISDVAADAEARDGYRGEDRDLGRAAGSRATGLRHVVLEPGQMSCPPHHHTAEEELFVVLDGTGELQLYDNGAQLVDRTALRAGSIVSRPAGTGMAHALVAGDDGLTYLAYGTRDPNEIVFYPRSRKAWLGRVMVRLDPAGDYWEGEE